MEAFDALILSGGHGRRLGGVDKASLAMEGDTLLGRALAAVARAERIVVVGRSSGSLPEGVRVACEHPPGGGPVAAIAAGLSYVESRVVVILACDMPLMNSYVVERLATRLESSAARLDESEPLTRTAGPNKSARLCEPAEVRESALGRESSRLRESAVGGEAAPGNVQAGLLESTPVDGVNLVDPSGRRQTLAAAYRTGALRVALTKLHSPVNASMRQLVGHLSIADLPVDASTTLDCDTWSDVRRCRELLNHNATEER